MDHIVFASNSVTVMTTTNTYDLLNRRTGVVSATNSVPAVSFKYAYNTANQRTAVTNVDGSYWPYQYDALGQVTSGAKYWGDGTVVAGEQYNYTFDTLGNRLTAAMGGDQYGANLRLASYTSDNLNQYTSRTVPGAVDVIGMATNTATVWVDQTQTYRKGNYFWLGLPVTNTSAAVYQTVTTLAALPNGTSAEYGVTNIGHAFVPQTPESYAYDFDGNLLSDGHWNYTWDGENRLVGMTSLSGAPTASLYQLAFTYDYQNRRIQKVISTNSGSGYIAEYTNRFVYDGWNVTATLNPNAALLATFIWGLDLSGSIQGAGGVGGLMAENLVGSGVQFVSYDANGNVAALAAAATGNVTANYEYGPFGEVIRATGPMAKLNPFRFSTKYQDDETDFLYYGYRYYNPSTGRWPSRDPLAEAAFFAAYTRHLGDYMALQLALYALGPVYCPVDNDSINHYDRFGLAGISIDGSGVTCVVVDRDEIVYYFGHGNGRPSPRFYFPAPRVSTAAAGFMGCYAYAVNNYIEQHGTLIPGSPNKDVDPWNGEIDQNHNAPDMEPAETAMYQGVVQLVNQWLTTGACTKVTVTSIIWDKAPKSQVFATPISAWSPPK